VIGDVQTGYYVRLIFYVRIADSLAADRSFNSMINELDSKELMI
jgi:hypothetical protein